MLLVTTKMLFHFLAYRVSTEFDCQRLIFQCIFVIADFSAGTSMGIELIRLLPLCQLTCLSALLQRLWAISKCRLRAGSLKPCASSQNIATARKLVLRQSKIVCS